MDRLGIVIDPSHMLGAAFEASLAVTTNPVVISHTAVAAVSMNKPDNTGTDQRGDATIRSMAKNGRHMPEHFLDDSPSRASHHSGDIVDDIIKHMVGIDCLGLTANYTPNQGPNVVPEMVRRGSQTKKFKRCLALT